MAGCFAQFRDFLLEVTIVDFLAWLPITQVIGHFPKTDHIDAFSEQIAILTEISTWEVYPLVKPQIISHKGVYLLLR